MHLPDASAVLADAKRRYPDNALSEGWYATTALAGYYQTALDRLRDLEERDDARRRIALGVDDGPEDDEADDDSDSDTHDMGEPVGRAEA